MGSIDLSPHKYRPISKGPNRGRKVVDYNNPNAYIRLHDKDQGTLFIQKGKLMYPDGVAIPFEDTPEWALKQIKAMTAESLKEVGYSVKPVLAEIEAKQKEKGGARDAAKKKAAVRAALAKARTARGKKKEDLPEDPEPEDVGLTEKPEEDAAE
jgi:hypothetical protein